MRITANTIDKVFRAQPGNTEVMEALGYELVEELFADSSGFGQDNEAALSVSQFERRVRELVAEHGTLTAKITGQGMFQVYVSLYTKTGVKTGRKLASNVHLLTVNGKRVVRLYDTDIITENGDGTITLNTGGFNTMTTSKRMNEFSSVMVYRKNWVMHCGAYSADDAAFTDNKITVPGTLRV